MSHRLKFTIFFCFAIVFGASNAANSQSGIDSLAFWLNGTFSNKNQADYEPGYVEFRIEIRQIWPDVAGEYWFYIEQIRGGVDQKVNSQGIYRLIPEKDGGIRAEAYEIPQPELYVGEWRRNNAFGSLLPSDLFLTENCDIMFYRKSNAYYGSYVKDNCGNGPRRVSYVTTEVIISEREISNWDRGFDKNGVQIWGPKSGPYLFQKTK